MTAKELNELGLKYWTGKDVEIDYSKALKYYRQAAELNYPTALYNLGICYSNGQGVEQDKEKAFNYFLKSAELGYIDGMFNTAISYLHGTGTNEDIQKSITWMTKAAKSKCGYACNFIGDCYRTGNYGYEKNLTKACEYYKLSSIYGDALGTLHLIGILLLSEDYKDKQDYLLELIETATIQSQSDYDRGSNFISQYKSRIIECTHLANNIQQDTLKQILINVKLYSVETPKIQSDIEKEYYHNGGYTSSFEQNKDKFYSKFDYISEDLTFFGNKTTNRLIQKGSRFGISAYIGVLIPPVYIQILTYPTDNWLNYICIDENMNWGIPALDGSEFHIVPFEYQCIHQGCEGFFPVKKDGKWGVYFHSKGDEQANFYKRYYPQKHFQKGSLLVIDCKYDDAMYFSEGLCAVKKDGKWGFIDPFDNVIIPFKYLAVTNFEGGYAKVMNENQTISIINHRNEESHFTNILLLDLSYRKEIEIVENYKDGEKTYSAIGPDKHVIIEAGKYKYLGNYREGLLAASLDGIHFGFVDITENIIIPFVYKIRHSYVNNWTYVFKNGIACVKLENGHVILINHFNKIVFPIEIMCDHLKYKDGCFETDDWGFMGLLNQFKKPRLSWIDLLRCNKGQDISYLVKTSEEIKKERERERERRRRESMSVGSYEWTDEDAWDAMTDGQYGDYPGSGWDSEMFGY